MTPLEWDRVQPLVDTALDLDPSEREEYLDRMCGGDPEIRRHAQSLIEAAENADGFLGMAVAEVATDALASHPLSKAAGLTTEVGQYRITRLLGQGGMGSVYEAEQRNPRRAVALKLIRPGFATPDLLRRFDVEAEALGRLQHPGIAQIYEAGTANTGFGPQPFFAMELIRGRPLLGFAQEEKLDSRQILELMARVCDAVQHAHERGIIHRDLKPANILVDQAGHPKILDFGVARIADAEGQITQTAVGQMVGTLNYMSPEQVGGEPDTVDPRTDVYSLGVILYELLTGRLPYSTRSKPLHEAARIIRTEDPMPLEVVNRAYRGDVATMVAKALEKDRLRRYASAGDLGQDIRRYLRDEPIRAYPPGVFYRMEKFARRHHSLAIGVAAVAGLLGAYLYERRSIQPAVPAQFLDTRPDIGAGVYWDEEGFALSPDGQTIVFRGSGKLRYLRLNGGEPSQVWAGSEDGKYPFWSADGKEVGFVWNGKLWRRAFPDGPPREICAAPGPVTATWGSRGDILFASTGEPLRRIPANGGKPIPLSFGQSAGGRGEQAASAFLPDGSHFLFFQSTPNRHRILAGSLSEPGFTFLTNADGGAVYLPDPGNPANGRLVFAREGRLLAQPFDARRVALSGQTSVISESARATWFSLSPASASVTGALAYVEREDKRDQAKVFGRDGRLRAKLAAPREYLRAAPSPDFSRLLLLSRDPHSKKWQADLLAMRGGSEQKFATQESPESAVWSRDGTRVAYTSDRESGGRQIRIVRASNGSEEINAGFLPDPGRVTDWSPDGRALLVVERHPAAKDDIWVFPQDGSAPPHLLVPGPGKWARFSPDGRFIAYQSDTPTALEVFVMPYPPDGRRWQVSSGGGMEPSWRADGRELFFLTPDYALMSTTVSRPSPAALSFGPPRHLFGGRAAEPALIVWHYEPGDPAGQEFIVLTGSARAPQSPLRLRLNWWAEGAKK